MQQYYNYRLSESLDKVVMDGEGRAIVVACLNPHSFVTALDDSEFRQALESCDVLLPDGEGVCLTMRWYGKRNIVKIAGDDLHSHLLRRLADRGGRVYYMGSRREVLTLIKRRVEREHAGIEVRCWSPSWGREIPEEESREILSDIKGFAPDVLFVGMTAPKQEKWVARHRDELSGVGVVASIGAVFEFYAGTVKRAPGWIVRLKMEWLVRLLKEPRRMWRRNFVSTPRFLLWTWKHRKEIIKQNTYETHNQ